MEKEKKKKCEELDKEMAEVLIGRTRENVKRNLKGISLSD